MKAPNEENCEPIVTEVKGTEPAIDQALVDKKTADLEALKKDSKGKVYPIKLDSNGIDGDAMLIAMITFIENEAQWKNMEALGIIEVSKALRKCQATGLKSGNIYLESLPIQAISFFLSKVENTGLQKAERHINMQKPFDEALRMIKQDTDKLNQAETELAAAENGISIEPTPEK
jgi:hypothetical protein